MTNAATSPRTSYKKTAYGIVAAQLLLTLLIAGALFISAGSLCAYSAVVGGLINVLSSLSFAWRQFSLRGPLSAQQAVRAFYIDEVFKFTVTIVSFAVAIIYLKVNMLIVFLVYIATITVYWFALLGKN